jgi:GTP pyrophosphokinase
MNENRVLISDLCNILAGYLPSKSITKVYDAYLLAADAHDGQYRKSGEAYVFHPLSVALILAKIKLDYESIIAAILHDVIEDTSTSKEQITEKFGPTVAHIVAGVSKIEDLEHKNANIKQAQNFRKLLFAASSDVRVLIIKLADRLHNMRTIDSMSKASQLRIARETEEIYIPIARRLGLATITKELKLLTFKTKRPLRYDILSRKIKQKYDKNAKVLDEAISILKNKLRELKIEFKISGRQKDLVSVYNKMRTKNLKFNEIFDLYALRIIVPTVAHCYQALGVVHNVYKPIPGKFKDYIALPKDNGYQSLHTIIFAQNKQLIEVQIRSQEMHNIAKYGIASHWYYKNNKTSTVPPWFSNISFNENDEEFIENAKAQFTKSDVFVFTPSGEIIKLPYKSTALDFAYSVHTDIGNYANKAIIDNIVKPLKTKVRSGQTIEIITKKTPNNDVNNLDIVQTLKAKYEIKSFLKKNFKQELINEGKELLTDVLYYQGIDINSINLDKYLVEFGVENIDELFSKISLKEILLSKLVSLINSSDYNEIVSDKINKTQKIKPELATCCYPLPGDKVVGIVNQNKGFVIHRSDCPYILKNKNLYNIDWHFKENDVFSTKISCNITNERGALASIATTIADTGINISGIDVKEQLNKTLLEFVIEVKSKEDLRIILDKLNALEFIKNATRV